MYSKDLFHRLPIIGILRGLEKRDTMRCVELFAAEGFTNIEVTMNTPEVSSILKEILQTYGSQLNVGAGTVRDEAELNTALESGAEYIVSPIVNKQVIESCVDKGIPVFPGAYTPTEVYEAWKMGATAVKLFPTATGGISHVKAVRAPLDTIPIIATGGVNSSNLASFFEAGVYGVGMGSQLFNKSAIKNKEWETISQQLKKTLTSYQAWSHTKEE